MNLVGIACAVALKVGVGSRFDGPAFPGIDPVVWDVLVGQLWRRGERMIPWRSGKRGNWSLNDHIEEIYLDKYLLEQALMTSLYVANRQISSITGMPMEYQVKQERINHNSPAEHRTSDISHVPSLFHSLLLRVLGEAVYSLGTSSCCKTVPSFHAA